MASLLSSLVLLVATGLFVSGQHHDLNLQAAFLHMAADAGISLAIVLGGLLMLC